MSALRIFGLVTSCESDNVSLGESDTEDPWGKSFKPGLPVFLK